MFPVICLELELINCISDRKQKNMIRMTKFKPNNWVTWTRMHLLLKHNVQQTLILNHQIISVDLCSHRTFKLLC